tara:strand:- start:331 stop:702 length:372 start_codon:yes stop_codon:yes gene_type:complete
VNIRGYAASGLDVKGRGFHSSTGNLWPQSYTATTTRTTATVTTEILFAASKTATAVPTGTALTTEITFQGVDNPANLAVTKSSLYISITLRILEPSIKDITADKEIIDFIETDERAIIQTQVI